ncbi:hypothetical protein AB5J52_12885 [Streptomyces sp. R39]|uniref:Uncharacterized protein n=1 Tax=Streptomyces sp. R39 TaxID=3238631 RepID=A0AB39R4L9_9ACTN
MAEAIAVRARRIIAGRAELPDTSTSGAGGRESLVAVRGLSMHTPIILRVAALGQTGEDRMNYFRLGLAHDASLGRLPVRPPSRP